jgi:hypothetical protein
MQQEVYHFVFQLLLILKLCHKVQSDYMMNESLVFYDSFSIYLHF